MNRHVYTNGHAGGGAYPMSPTFVESRGRTFNIRPDKYEKYVRSLALWDRRPGQHQTAGGMKSSCKGPLTTTANADTNHDPQDMPFTDGKAFFSDLAVPCPFSPSSS